MAMGKHILVIGAGKSGIAACNLLAKEDAEITLFDSDTAKSETELRSRLSKDYRGAFCFGELPEEMYTTTDLVIISPLDTVERTVSRFEPGSSALAKHVPLESMPDALADALGLMSAEAIPAGSLAVFVCRRSKAIQCEGVFLIQEAKNSAALRIGLVHLDRYTPSGILPHSLQMSQGFSKRRVVEISGKVEGILQTPAGRIVSHEWQFEQKCLGSFRHARHYRTTVVGSAKRYDAFAFKQKLLLVSAKACVVIV